MTYQETCDYLFNQMPMFERQGASGYKEGLGNTLALDEHFGHPHQAYLTIHVGGTNGKGSCSHSIAAILQECGYKVGLYTSPHLIDFRERIRVNGVTISEEYVVNFVEKERSFFEPLHPSFFELTTAMAFQYFKDKAIDIAVVEVGLGGRLDCTNIITPIVSLITNISLDHTQFLGDTLPEIAKEKAGIIKPGVPVVIGEANKETRPIFEKKAQEVGAPVIFAEDDPMVSAAYLRPEGGMIYETKIYGTITGDLSGIYQQKNLNTIMAVLQVLQQKGIICDCHSGEDSSLYAKEIPAALSHVAAITGLMGRWQVIKKSPYVVCDTGHNVGGWEYLTRQIQQTHCQHLHMIFGMVNDKDIDGVLALLPKNATYYFTRIDSHRTVDEKMLLSLASKYGLSGAAYPTVHEAYQVALGKATRNDFIFVGGSSYIVGDFLKSCN